MGNKYRIVIAEDAVRDLEKIIEYINIHNSIAAKRLKVEIIEKFDGLLEYPFRYREGIVDNTREMLTAKNYVTIYSVENEIITILRVLHSAQRWPFKV
ncbi:type II toxin-antitoxin system RelE/ParE family toxin [Bartonella harrusi]|uniref:Type II toxin-antitoxin system RelE/ParE family toxin n=1 Tax=Bartonella harrusi TaxID=2961895 RepID=A0ABY5EX84_9HYPH|nr:type II toxin-antitoxin system RelE/ParE family toxin [Bartonella harrusi]UTO28704.1 type II toxin-antitoxin system RelE/ParE family toxin [Bartonella harrusi]UTO29073.1 type II toxin-antitoxin system RelE/ParE family toxin [Bartonella harrusi]